jgi:hypothetical protein
VLVKSPTDPAKLVNAKEIHRGVNFPFNPANHSREKVTDKLKGRLGLLYRKSLRPRKSRRTVCQGDEPLPAASGGATSELVNEPSHAIRITEPTGTGSMVLTSA